VKANGALSRSSGGMFTGLEFFSRASIGRDEFLLMAVNAVLGGELPFPGDKRGAEYFDFSLGAI
jgi:hypothetical protein